MNQEGSSGEMRKNMKYGSKLSRCFATCLLNQLTLCGHIPALSSGLLAFRG